MRHTVGSRAFKVGQHGAALLAASCSDLKYGDGEVGGDERCSVGKQMVYEISLGDGLRNSIEPHSSVVLEWKDKNSLEIVGI